MNVRLFGACFALILISCQDKSDYIEETCEQIKAIRIVGAKPTYYIGDTLDLNTNHMANTALYLWNLNDNPNIIGNHPNYRTESLKKEDEGWYYLHVSNHDCASTIDSVYIKVLNRPANAPCTPQKNTAEFNNLPDIFLTPRLEPRDPLYGRRAIIGRYATGYPDLQIYLNKFWDSREPEDGTYFVGGFPALFEDHPYSIYIASRYNDVIFSSGSGKAYVTHPNGKLTVTFCNLDLTGSVGGTVLKTNGSGTMTIP